MYRLYLGGLWAFVVMNAGFMIWSHLPRWSSDDLLLLYLWGMLFGLGYIALRWCVLAATGRRRRR